MRALLLNDGGFGGMEDVKFPVEVEADEMWRHLIRVPVSELERIGCDMSIFDRKAGFYSFATGTEIKPL